MGWIFRMNMAACIVVPCIAAARKKLLYRIPGRTWLFLWKILIFRLLCPLTFELQLKNVDVSRTAANIFRQREKMGLPADGLLLSVSEILKIIWLAGVIAAVVFLSVRIWREEGCIACRCLWKEYILKNGKSRIL